GSWREPTRDRRDVGAGRSNAARRARSSSRSPESALIALRDLLHRPAVAVGIVEEHERAPREVLDLADVDPALDELGARRLDVGHDDLQTPHRTRRHVTHAAPE